MNDALGDVAVNVKAPCSPTTLAGLTFTAGKQTSNGTEALAFVRERKSFPGNDYTRVENQQLFLKAVIMKTISKETLLNPVTINNMVGAISPFVRVDQDFDAATIGSLALQFKDVRESDTVMFTLPNLWVRTSADCQPIVVVDNAAISEIAAATGKDQLAVYATANNLGN